MKYFINDREESEKVEEKRTAFAKARDGFLLVFSLCLATLFIFFLNGGNKENKVEQNDEIISVFKETPLYDFLDLEMTEENKNSGEVSDFEDEK